MTAAEQSCASTFMEQTNASRTFQAIEALNESTIRFLRTLSKKPETLTIKSLKSEVRKLEELSEDYLRISGFSFKKVTRFVQVNNLKDSARSYLLQYSLYELKASRTASEEAARINEIQKNPKFKNRVPVFILDPLYDFNYKSGAHITGDSKKIVFGPDVSTFIFIGVQDNLEHEIQHYYETLKLQAGEMSLARIRLFNPVIEDVDVNYQAQLPLDELESYLRNFRYSIDANRIKQKDAQLISIGASADKMQEIRELRLIQQRYHEKNLTQFLAVSRLAVSELIEKLQGEIDWSAKHAFDLDSGFIEVRSLLPSAATKLYLDLSGIIKRQDFAKLSEAQLKEVTLQTLIWSLRRIDEIAVEFNQAEKISN